MKYSKTEESSSNDLRYIDSNNDRCNDEINKNANKTWPCNICGKEFRYPYTLLRHMPIHTKERKFKCDKCSKAFRQMSTLSQHRATHSSAKPYVCETCGKSFNRGSTLISHRRTHQEIKRFSCSICHKAFHQKGNLVNHIYTHTNERPYRCDVCFKGFNQKSNLVCHMFTVHGKKKSYTCEYCPASFSRENTYKIHLASSHRLGTMPVVENDIDSDNLSISQDNQENQTKYYQDFSLDNENKRQSIYDESGYENSINSINKICDKGPIKMVIEETSMTKQNVVLNITSRNTGDLNNKDSRKKLLKIPALLNQRVIKDIKREVERSSLKDVVCRDGLKNNFKTTTQQLNRSKKVIADTIITDMGRNLVVREKPPFVLEEARSKGQTPFLLVIEEGLSPRLCKASLGTEGFIVSPITIMDIDRISTSDNFKIPILMTIRRFLESNNELKTFIHTHSKPIELNILQNSSENAKKNMSDGNEAKKIERQTSPIQPKIELNNEDSLCIKVKNTSTSQNPTTSKTMKNIDYSISNDYNNKRESTVSTKLSLDSEIDNMIRLHLSQLGESQVLTGQVCSENENILKVICQPGNSRSVETLKSDNVTEMTTLPNSEDNVCNNYGRREVSEDASLRYSTLNYYDEKSDFINIKDETKCYDEMFQTYESNIEFEINEYLGKYYFEKLQEKRHVPKDYKKYEVIETENI